MLKVFINYRRDDSNYAASYINNALCDHFGRDNIIFDVDSIPLGSDFRQYINDQVSQCDVVLAVIGDCWLSLLDQRRDDPQDYVRIEIEAALNRDIPVVPVLVDEAIMPGEEDLVPEIAVLAYRTASEVRGGKDLNDHLTRLIKDIENYFTGDKYVRQTVKRGKDIIDDKFDEAKEFLLKMLDLTAVGEEKYERQEYFEKFYSTTWELIYFLGDIRNVLDELDLRELREYRDLRQDIYDFTLGLGTPGFPFEKEVKEYNNHLDTSFSGKITSFVKTRVLGHKDTAFDFEIFKEKVHRLNSRINSLKSRKL
jgi:hypothetical protein